MSTPEYLTISKIKEVAECSWWEKTSPKHLAEKFNLTEDQVNQLRLTPEYQEQVESLMLGQRSAEDFEKWVKNYHNMNSAFGKRMGLDPKVVTVMVENVRKAHVDIAAGKAKAPEGIPNPSRNINLNSEKTIGTGRNSVYLYYDQQKRESAESKGENVWECKIGRTEQELHTRIYQQASTAERFKLGLHIKTDKEKKIERIIHDILKVRGRYVDSAPGREWFLTSPSEVKEIYKFIGESPCENT
ncbi:MAG: GIY-YIG nuclease family protein [Candidatus Poribacteria bacterium]|nr:GIY-YIG nuclease family protein [Candidatus Poribacteria bacterium]